MGVLPYFRLQSLRPIVYHKLKQFKSTQMFESWYLWFPLDCIAMALVWRTAAFNMPLPISIVYGRSVCVPVHLPELLLTTNDFVSVLCLPNEHHVTLVWRVLSLSVYSIHSIDDDEAFTLNHFREPHKANKVCVQQRTAFVHASVSVLYPTITITMR